MKSQSESRRVGHCNGPCRNEGFTVKELQTSGFALQHFKEPARLCERWRPIRMSAAHREVDERFAGGQALALNARRLTRHGPLGTEFGVDADSKCPEYGPIGSGPEASACSQKSARTPPRPPRPVSPRIASLTFELVSSVAAISRAKSC